LSIRRGNGVFVAATASLIYGLTVAGSKYSWTSYKSLVPIIVGVVGTVAAIYVEKRWVKNPTIPFTIFTNRTSAMGFLQVFIHAVAVLCVVYYLREWAFVGWGYWGSWFAVAVFYQAVEGHGPIRSGVDILPLVSYFFVLTER
jgi:hypothetical protein